MFEWLYSSDNSRLILVNNVLIIYTALTVALGSVAYLKRKPLVMRLFNWMLVRRRLEPHENLEKIRARFKGIIFTVSKPELPCIMMESLKPKAAGFIVTAQSKNALVTMNTTCTLHGVTPGHSYDIDMADAEAAKKEAKRLVGWMESECGIPRDEIVFDLTGGTVAMSLGAFMASEEMGVSSLYVKSDYDDKLRSYIAGTQKPVLIPKLGAAS